MKAPAQEKLFNTTAMTSTRRMSALKLARLRKDQPHLFKYGNGEPTAPPAETVEFNMPDEARVLQVLKARCPECGTRVELWRGVDSVSGKSFYQVRCKLHVTLKGFFICKQEPLPNPPSKSSHDAVRIWTLAAKLAQ